MTRLVMLWVVYVREGHIACTSIAPAAFLTMKKWQHALASLDLPSVQAFVVNWLRRLARKIMSRSLLSDTVSADPSSSSSQNCTPSAQSMYCGDWSTLPGCIKFQESAWTCNGLSTWAEAVEDNC